MSATKSGVRRESVVPLVLLLVALVAFGTVGGSASVASAQLSSTSTPALSITLESPEGEVETGDRLAYTATVVNHGLEPFAGSVVVEPADFVTVDEAAGAELSENSAVWVVQAAAGDTQSFDFAVTVGSIPDFLTRVTTLVSVYGSDEAQPIIRTAHAARIVGVDEVPGNGVVEQPAAPVTEVGEATETTETTEVNVLPLVLMGVLLLFGVGAAAAAIVLRRRATAPVGPRRRRQGSDLV